MTPEDEDLERLHRSPIGEALDECWDGEALGRAMRASDVTTFDVALQVGHGVTADDVSEWISGECPGPLVAYLLAERLGVESWTFFPGLAAKSEEIVRARKRAAWRERG